MHIYLASNYDLTKVSEVNHRHEEDGLLSPQKSPDVGRREVKLDGGGDIADETVNHLRTELRRKQEEVQELQGTITKLNCKIKGESIEKSNYLVLTRFSCQKNVFIQIFYLFSPPICLLHFFHLA